MYLSFCHLVLSFHPCATSHHACTCRCLTLCLCIVSLFLFLLFSLWFSAVLPVCRRPLSYVHLALHMGSSWVAVGPALCLAAPLLGRGADSCLRAFHRAPGHCSNWQSSTFLSGKPSGVTVLPWGDRHQGSLRSRKHLVFLRKAVYTQARRAHTQEGKVWLRVFLFLFLGGRCLAK